MYYRYIKPTYSKSKSAVCAELTSMTRKSKTVMLLQDGSKVYRFKFAVEDFSTRRQALDMYKKAKASENWKKYFVEVA